jgi:hypothetical protein
MGRAAAEPILQTSQRRSCREWIDGGKNLQLEVRWSAGDCHSHGGLLAGLFTLDVLLGSRTGNLVPPAAGDQDHSDVFTECWRAVSRRQPSQG